MVASVVPVFENVGESSTAKNYHLRLLFVVSKIFVKCINNRPVNLEKCGLLSDLQYGFRSSRPAVDLLIVLSGRANRVFTRYRAIML